MTSSGGKSETTNEGGEREDRRWAAPEAILRRPAREGGRRSVGGPVRDVEQIRMRALPDQREAGMPTGLGEGGG